MYTAIVIIFCQRTNCCLIIGLEQIYGLVVMYVKNYYECPIGLEVSGPSDETCSRQHDSRFRPVKSSVRGVAAVWCLSVRL